MRRDQEMGATAQRLSAPGAICVGDLLPFFPGFKYRKAIRVVRPRRFLERPTQADADQLPLTAPVQGDFLTTRDASARE
jgi:hypothetical protein